jgi:hypothetical protein
LEEDNRRLALELSGKDVTINAHKLSISSLNKYIEVLEEKLEACRSALNNNH